MATSPPNKTVRIFVVEPQEISRTGFRLIFEADQKLQIIGEADDLSDSLAEIIQISPTLLMLKITNENNDLDLISQIKQSCPSIQVMAFFESVDANMICRFIAAAVNGFCMTTVNIQHLLNGIHAVASGGMWLSPTAASAVSGTLFTDKQHGTKPALHQELNFTEREREILKRLVKGYTNQKIAVELGLSVETVKTYIRRIMDKSSIRSRKQLLSVYKKLNNMHSEAKPIAPPGVKPKSV